MCSIPALVDIRNFSGVLCNRPFKKQFQNKVKKVFKGKNDKVRYLHVLVHGPLTKGRITQRFLSEGVMETFLSNFFILASSEG
jgi:hypothetical protein